MLAGWQHFELLTSALDNKAARVGSAGRLPACARRSQGFERVPGKLSRDAAALSEFAGGAEKRQARRGSAATVPQKFQRDAITITTAAVVYAHVIPNNVIMVDATGRRKARVSAVSLSRLRGKASANLEELTRELLRLTSRRKGDGLSAELRDVVYTLKAHELRSGRNAHAFRVGGGLAALLRLAAGCGGRDAVLLLGAVGNLCALDSQSRREVCPADNCIWLCNYCFHHACSKIPSSGEGKCT